MATRQHHPCNEDLRARLDAYRNSYDPPLTNKVLARELSCGHTQVSKYLNDKCDWDIAGFEATLEDVMKSAEIRRTLDDHTHLETSVTLQVNAVCETIRKTNDVGLISGPAGIGKSVAIVMYVKSNPSAIAITLTRWACNCHGVARLLFEALENRMFSKSKKSKAEWIIDRLKNSNRILIIDNAHRLTKSGLEWLFDFQDATRVPIALVGNPEVLDAVSDNDQQYSRIGLVQEVKLDNPDKVAASIVQQLTPGTDGKIRDLATTIASKRGHLRSLKKHLLLIPELLTACDGDPREAMLSAHTQLVSDYKLS